MTIWEYQTVALDIRTGFLGSKFNGDKINRKLNRMGGRGWELVSALDTNRYQGASDKIVLVFKRELGS